MKTTLSDLITSATDYIKQAKEQSAIRSEQRRKYEEERHRQELEASQRQLYQSPYTLQLSGEQLVQIQMNYIQWNDTSSVTLLPQQSREITSHFVNQAVINNDIATQKEIVTGLTLSFDSYMDNIRILHKCIYDSFIRAYYPDRTYAEVMPVNEYFVCCNNKYGLIYSCNMTKQSSINAMNSNFRSFLGTQECKQLMRHFKLNEMGIGYNIKLQIILIYVR